MGRRKAFQGLVFNSQGHGNVGVNVDDHTEAGKVEPTKRQLSAAQRSVAKKNIPAGLLWVPPLEIQVPDVDELEEVFTLKDEKREEILVPLQRSQEAAENRDEPRWGLPRVGDLVMVRRHVLDNVKGSKKTTVAMSGASVEIQCF